MYKIQQITQAAKQKQLLFLQDGTSMELTIEFKPMQYGWFIVDLTYGDFILKGVRISVGPNMLYQFKNQIPFGLACFSKTNREPMLQQDFVSGECELFILSEEEVQEYADILNGQV